MKKTIPIAVLILGTIGLSVWWLARGTTAGPLRASGTVEVTEAHLGFVAGGTITSVLVEEGDVVKADDPLAVLDTARLSARLRSAMAQEAAAEARLSEALSGARPEERATAAAGATAATQRHAQTMRDLERARSLFEGGAISRQQFEQAETARDLAEAAMVQAQEQAGLVSAGPRQESILALRSARDAATAVVAELESALGEATLRAPFDGLVAIRHREPGEITGPGGPVVTLQQPDRRWVRVFIPEVQMERIQLGQSVSIFSDGRPDAPFSGTVTYLGARAEFTPRNVQTKEDRMKLVYPAKVTIDGDPNHELKAGLPVDVEIETTGDPTT